MDTAPVGLVCLLINDGTSVSTTFTVFFSCGRDLMEGMDVCAQFALGAAAPPPALLVSEPSMDLGLLSLLPPLTPERPLPLRAIDSADDDCCDGAVGAKPKAAGAQRTRRAMDRFMVLVGFLKMLGVKI